MSDDVLICPSCRARVFGHWSACKFCGTSLRGDQIGATVDPDELTAAPDHAAGATPPGPATPEPPQVPAAAMPPDRPSDEWDPSWSPWAWEQQGSDADWATAPGHQDAAGSLVPVEDAEPTWAPGPAPSVTGPGDGGASQPMTETAPHAVSTWERDDSPSGLDPVAWYPEPGAEPDPPTAPDPPGWSTGPGPDHGPSTAPAGWSTGPAPDPVGPSSTGPGSGWDLPTPDLGAPATDLESPYHPPSPPAGGFGAPTGAPPQPEQATPSFDTEAIFRDPEPDPAPVPSAYTGGFGTGLEQRLGDDIGVRWEPAAADAWDTPVEPKGKPKRQAVLSRESRLLLFGIIISLLAVVALTTFQEREGHPPVWAANVQEMADWVAEAREVPFEHPVTVATLEADEYDAAVAAATRPPDDEISEGLAVQTGIWRALGAVQGDTTARLQAVAAQQPHRGAFYDLANEQLVVRFGSDQANLQIGLAGALSVALDAQRADLSSVDTPTVAENPRFDVVFGTAELMRHRYADSIDAASEITAEDVAAADETEPAGFLDALPAFRSSIGAPFVQMMGDLATPTGADDLAASPPVSSQQVLNPTAFIAGQGPLAVPQPTAPEGTEKVDEGSIGATTWYLLLGAHLESPDQMDTALDFAERWAGDHFVAYKTPEGQVCVTDVLRGSNEAQTGQLHRALQNWVATIDGDHVRVELDNFEHVVVTGCDPGPDTVQGLGPALDAVTVAASTRSGLAAHYYLEGTKIPNGVNGPVFTPEVAWCMGDRAVHLADPAQLPALANHTDPTYRALTLEAGSRCGSTMADQLFVPRDD